MDPLVPFRVPGGVGLLVLGLEDADDLALGVPGEVAAGAPLRDHAGVHALADGLADAVDDGVELLLGHVAGLGHGEHLGGGGADALGGLEDGVVDLEALLLALLLGAAALELGGDLVGPALEAGVDGLEVDARVAAAVAAEAAGGARRLAAGGRRVRRLRRGHARVRAGLADRGIARGRRRLQRGVAGGEGVVVRLVAEVGLRKPLVPRGGGPRHGCGLFREEGEGEGEGEGGREWKREEEEEEEEEEDGEPEATW